MQGVIYQVRIGAENHFLRKIGWRIPQLILHKRIFKEL